MIIQIKIIPYLLFAVSLYSEQFYLSNNAVEK